MATKLIATQSYPYAGRSLQCGDCFEASDRDAHILKTVGRAKDAPPDPTPAPKDNKLTSKVLTAEDDSAEKPAAPARRRRYRRRDLQAEE